MLVGAARRLGTSAYQIQREFSRRKTSLSQMQNYRSDLFQHAYAPIANCREALYFGRRGDTLPIARPEF